jgi:hypothetical protein
MRVNPYHAKVSIVLLHARDAAYGHAAIARRTVLPINQPSTISQDCGGNQYL